MPFDLSVRDTKTAAEAGIVVQLTDPATGETLLDGEATEDAPKGSPVTITILGGDAGKVRDKARKSLDQVFEKIRKKKELGGAKESEQEQIDRLAEATVAWTGFVVDGKPMACTVPNAKKLYGDPRFPWIVEQLQAKIDDRASFFPKDSSN